jgi:hypothetical protein
MILSSIAWMKFGRIIKNPITGGSNGLPALKNEKKKVTTK